MRQIKKRRLQAPGNKLSDNIKKQNPKHKLEKRIQERKIELRFRPDQIGQETIDKIIRYYNNLIELGTILKTVNSTLPFNLRLSLVDVYTILFIAKSQKKVRQRRKHLEFELPLDEFAKVYKEWKKGKMEADIPYCIEGSHIGVVRVLRSLYTRSRAAKQQKKLDAIVDAQEVLAQGTVMFVENRQAIVIFLDTINDNTRNRLLDRASEIAEEFTEELNQLEQDAPNMPPRRIQPPDDALRPEEDSLDEPEELTYDEEVDQIIDNLLPETKQEEDSPEATEANPEDTETPVKADEVLLKDPEILGEQQVQEKIKDILG